jgi:MFS family permease
MIGFGIGGILMGRLSDRFGVLWAVLVGTLGLGAGFIAAGSAGSLWQFSLAQGVLIGLLGTSATFVPLVADTSQWFTRRRGIAVAICMSGNTRRAPCGHPSCNTSSTARAGARPTSASASSAC